VGGPDGRGRPEGATIQLIIFWDNRPGGRHAHHGLATYAEAEAMEIELNKLSRYGRRAVIYAVRGERSTPCTPELIAMAREINPAL
jgi:hypothetical protein